MKKTLFCIFFLFSICFYQATQAENKDSAILIRKSSDFKIDGKGSAPNWQNTEWIRISPRTVSDQNQETRAKVLYSEKGIYFLFDCADRKLSATLKGDFLKLYEEDVVEVFLWPSEDFPVYFEYEISPLNYELPIMVPNNKGKFFGWLPWQYEGEKKTRHETSVKGGKKKSGASITGWMAEFFIPYKLLEPLPKMPPVSGTKWRANMYRIDYDNGNGISYWWQPTKSNFHDYNSYGTFIFE